MTNLKIEVKNLETIKSLLNTNDLVLNTAIEVLPNCSINCLTHNNIPEFVSTTIVVEIAISFGAGVSSSVVASYLYDKLIKKEAKIISSEKRKILVEKGDLKIFIEEEIERK